MHGIGHDSATQFACGAGQWPITAYLMAEEESKAERTEAYTATGAQSLSPCMARWHAWRRSIAKGDLRVPASPAPFARRSFHLLHFSHVDCFCARAREQINEHERGPQPTQN